MSWTHKKPCLFDGNKRIGILAMMTFLELNGTAIACADEELIALGFGIASGKIDQKQILAWIIKHSVKYK